MKLKNWELVGWRYSNNGNCCISLSEEQAYALFHALGIKIENLPNDEYNIKMYTDEYLKQKRKEQNIN